MLLKFNIRRKKLFFAVLMGCFLSVVTSSARTVPEARENAIKAGFLLGFNDFITWNAEAQKSSKKLTIGVIGEGDFSKSIKQVLVTKKIPPSRASLVYFDTPGDIEPVRFLFVQSIREDEFAEVIQHCEQQGIVTVSDKSGFVERGGIIELVKRGNRLKFVINVDAAKRSNVRISSKLIRLAERKRKG